MDHKERSRLAVNRAHTRATDWLTGWQEHVNGVKAVHDNVMNTEAGYNAKQAIADGIALTVSWYDAAFGWMLSPNDNAKREKKGR